MSTESKLHDKLQGLADAGPAPDEQAAWAAIADRMGADQTRRRRSRWIYGAGGVLVAGAAAALLVAVTTGDDAGRAVDIGPSDTTEVPTPSTVDPTPGTVTVDLPANPVLATAQTGRVLHVLDGDTGEVVATPVKDLQPGLYVFDEVIDAKGNIYFGVGSTNDQDQFGIGTTKANRVGYDLLPLPALPERGAYMFPSISPDGETLALSVHRDIRSTEAERSILLHDVATGESRELRWPAGDERRPLNPMSLSFSRDGSRLAFMAQHDTDVDPGGHEAYVVDVGAASLAEARLVAEDIRDVTFTPDGGLAVVEGPDFAWDSMRFVEGGRAGIPEVGEDPNTLIADLYTSPTQIYAWTTDDTLRYDAASNTWVDAGFERDMP